MSTSTKRRLAEKLYNSGRDLFQEGLYSEALVELRRAEDAFRMWDAHGHPFTDRLSNGVSGLANTLALAGLCNQKLGNLKAALTCYETVPINAKFEKKKALHAITQNLAENLIVCYEKALAEAGLDRESFLGREPEIDTSFRFPYSLPADVIPAARLYELAPDRYARYEDFYLRAKKKDASIRKLSRTSDESTMKRASIYVWSILAAIWIVYGFIVTNALIHNK
jgi:tetratricopeptide (TPR) repeat protein